MKTLRKLIRKLFYQNKGGLIVNILSGKRVKI